eukprot:7870396-Heterocapsa_arctica.AAC.1
MDARMRGYVAAWTHDLMFVSMHACIWPDRQDAKHASIYTNLRRSLLKLLADADLTCKEQSHSSITACFDGQPSGRSTARLPA